MTRGRSGRLGLLVVLAVALPAVPAAAAPHVWGPRIEIAPHALNAVACPSPNLCLAVGNRGVTVSATSPAGGAAAWTAATIDGGRRLISLSCPAATFCAATDNASAVLTSANPRGAASAWTAHTIDPGRWITAISCASSHLCVAVDRRGGILSSTRPADPHRGWTRVEIPHASFVGVSCPSSAFCVAADADRRMFVSSHPAGGRRDWRSRTMLPSDTVLLGVSCARADACMAVNYENGTDVAFRPSRHPSAAGVWRPDGDVVGYPHEGTAGGAVSCVGGGFCAGITHSDFSYGDGWTTSDFGHHWRHVALGGPSTSAIVLLTDIACAGTSLCVAVDNGGGAIVGS